jgi:cytochrome c-type biogenesis protein CcmF
MRNFGELCLLGAFVSSGVAAFVHLHPPSRALRRLRAIAVAAAVASVLGLTAVMAILAWALLAKDFQFAYVAQYSSRQLPWHYSLSALWVGQAGSLLLWAWFVGALAMLYRLRTKGQPDAFHATGFGILMGYVCFLSVIMVFAADPMAPTLSAPRDGAGLSPLLQHPAMLIHPPVVFLAYALWTVPFALAVSALLTNRLDTSWIRPARAWSLAAWVVLGVGILLGADWAYEELGWGGYWGWDPVENGSLLPWLTGTALIHCLMTWQYRGAFKKTTLALAIGTFGLCNFASFLTRSGVFSSLHAFSESPIGWLFLGLMIALVGGGLALLVLRREQLAAEQPVRHVLSREAFVWLAAVALLLLATAVLGGTISTALSGLIYGRTVMVGPAFYNHVLIPTGFLLLATTVLAPLLRWGRGPSQDQRRWLLGCAGAGLPAMLVAVVSGIRHPLALATVGVACAALVAVTGSLFLAAGRRMPGQRLVGMLVTLRLQRRQYAGFLVHLGFVCLAIGITGSSLGKREQGFTLSEGQAVDWAGRQIRLVRLHQRQLPDKLVAEAELEITAGDGARSILRPAQHFHRLQEQWTTEVAIQSTWLFDFYTILHSGEADGPLYLTFVENPLMRWIWAGGGIMVLGAGIRLWPAQRRAARRSRTDADRRSPATSAGARRRAAA